jgi:hypothetical protein
MKAGLSLKADQVTDWKISWNTHTAQSITIIQTRSYLLELTPDIMRYPTAIIDARFLNQQSGSEANLAFAQPHGEHVFSVHLHPSDKTRPVAAS